MEDISSREECINDSLEDQGFLDMELEALQSIYINEIEVNKDVKTTVSIELYPATADKLDKQYVRMTLQFILDERYPDVIPEIKIRNPRGLSDENLNNITEDLFVIAEEKRGNSMLFEMIEAAKEHLTIGNRPSGQCAICLYGFNESDVFTKTECYHYFHSHCLARYSRDFCENSSDGTEEDKNKAISSELLCPMCRIPIAFSGSVDQFPPPVANEESGFVLTEEIVDLQKKMANLYQKQLEKGGIIDVEAEKNKFLLEISNVPSQPVAERVIKPVSETINETDMKPESADTSTAMQTDKGRKNTQDRNQRPDNKGRNKQTSRGYDNKGNQKFYKYDKQPHYQSNRRENNSDQSGSKASKWEDTVEEKSPVDEADNGSNYADSRDVDVVPANESLPNTSESRPSSNYQARNGDYSPRNRGGFRRGFHQNRGYSNYNQKYRSNFTEREHQNSYSRYNTENDKEHSPSDNARTGDFRRYDYSEKRPYRGGRSRGHYDSYSSYSRGNYSGNRHYQDSNSSYKRNATERTYQEESRYRRSDTSENRHYNRERTYHEESRYRRSDTSENTHYNRERNFREHKAVSKRPENSKNYSDDYKASGNFRSDKFVNKSLSATSNDKTQSTSSNDKPPFVTSNEKINSVLQGDSPQNSDNHPVIDCANSKDSSNSSQAKEIKNKPCLPNETVVGTLPGASNAFSSRVVSNPPPGFANPMKKVIYGLQGANPPPGFQRS